MGKEEGKQKVLQNKTQQSRVSHGVELAIKSMEEMKISPGNELFTEVHFLQEMLKKKERERYSGRKKEGKEKENMSENGPGCVKAEQWGRGEGMTQRSLVFKF